MTAATNTIHNAARALLVHHQGKKNSLNFPPNYFLTDSFGGKCKISDSDGNWISRPTLCDACTILCIQFHQIIKKEGILWIFHQNYFLTNTFSGKFNISDSDGNWMPPPTLCTMLFVHFHHFIKKGSLWWCSLTVSVANT